LPAIAELGWSPASTHNVKAFDQRVAAQSQRWKLLDINYYRSSQVSWPDWS
jgi:hexosaminidase